MIQSVQTILFVSDPGLSRDFYRRVLAGEPCLDVPGMTQFPLCTGCQLGLMPVAGARRLLALDITERPGLPQAELYLYVDRPQDYLERAMQAGGQLVSPLSLRNWGDEAGYVLDPDGHLLAFARPPQ
ncbi:VOC family protein [bacterium]|nr:VOC family protein [bacterium]